MPLDHWRAVYPGKFVSEEEVFGHIHRGDTIFIGSACAEPQYLVQSLIRYVKSHPKAFFDAEVLHIRSLGVAPYATEKFKQNFRHNSFFIGDSTRDAVNKGVADYTPVFLSQVPDLFRRGLARVDVALIQTSSLDIHGYMSLGISVDIVKAAVEKASVVIAQVNPRMPRVHGDTFIHIDNVDFIVPYEEELLEYSPQADTEIARRIGKYVARLVEDGDTIQVGYGRIPNAIIAALSEKKHLGVHTELISDGIVTLMKKGVIDNTRKSINRGKTVATFCMGTKETFDYLHDNPSIEFHPIDYTNNPLIIAQHDNMTAINSALEIDLTGQATAESIGRTFYSGVGGHADFMRGAVLSRGGKTILVIQSTAAADTVSRIVPSIREGAGITLTRGDVHYVVTEYGIAYLNGKSIRERAMELIAIAHPKFRPWLIAEAKKAGLIYQDQAFIPGERGIYPEELETWRTTKTGLNLLFRPIKISDEPLLKDFLYSLSDLSLYRRFMWKRFYMPHEFIQELVVIDYQREMAILAVMGEKAHEQIVGVGRYFIDPDTHTAEVAFAIREDFQNQGIATELLSYLTYLAKRQGLLGFTAEVFADNAPMLHVFEKGGFDMQKRTIAGLCELKLMFRQEVNRG
ncbi:MAG TPA: GNAT family N-acetyltransferase [Syntrophales bacterium]|nr:GNAT family N-acetyltransferase [Syntrophales bacterium]HOM07906.1 GNAT family N-acetyltransferase [Syntrophales bacterium]HOO00560.1 GNAT family N-acetyltransferase [Syntrophales bacterium]HPQ06592.1 GNAT family N-acetyltransferase [Syntrophales bacterium]